MTVTMADIRYILDLFSHVSGAQNRLRIDRLRLTISHEYAICATCEKQNPNQVPARVNAA